MRKILLLFTFLSAVNFSFGQDIKIGVRDTLSSKILNQEREFTVYLPPSYHSMESQTYPVLYILDGDYNFRYVAGILELEGGISERIPEMILVAISGKGTETYRYNCRPNIAGAEEKGNAGEVANFMSQELIPYVNSTYKTNGFQVLSGHSIGGLFVMNTALNHPQLFDRYIAISPALYWGNHAINKIAKDKVNADDFKTKVYTSLANEQGMGVASFLTVATSSVWKNEMVIYGIALLAIILALFLAIKSKRKRLALLVAIVGMAIASYLWFVYYPRDNNFKFKKFAHENHNSVGEPTYRWALEAIFETWGVEKQYFSSAEELKKHYNQVRYKYGVMFTIPSTVLGNTYYKLKDNPKELDKVQKELQANYPNAFERFGIYRANKVMEEQPKEAKKIIGEVLAVNPKSSESYYVLAKLALAKNNKQNAIAYIETALKMAIDQQERQWKINELLEMKNKILERNTQK